MPRYFFHVYDGTASRDTEGTELRDIYTAQAEAIHLSGAVLRDMGAKFWNSTGWSLEVADERGCVLFVLRFSAEERPTLPDAAPIPGGTLSFVPRRCSAGPNCLARASRWPHLARSQPTMQRSRAHAGAGKPDRTGRSLSAAPNPGS
jgi:hypothetical protein